MSQRTQKVLIWWAIVFMVIYGLTLVFLLHMVPPPRATLNAQGVSDFYARHHDSIRIGAVMASYTSAFMVPISIAVAVQIARLEKGRPIWAMMCGAGGCLMSIFLVLPPLFWGVAAYTPTRDPQVTAVMHELGMLTLVTTDQYYVFMWVAIVAVCLMKTDVAHSPFPRWFGYLTAWTALMFEAGAIAFLPRTGPFAWNGLLVFWSPFLLFSVWLATMSTLLLKAINKQAQDASELVEPPSRRAPVPVPV